MTKLLFDEADNSFKGRDRVLYKNLQERDPNAALDWLKTKYYVQNQANYGSVIKRAKRGFNYSLKVGTDYEDTLLAQSNKLRAAIRALYDATVAKKPNSNSEFFGVEIEFFMKPDSKRNIGIRKMFQEFCIENKIKLANIKGDGSISPHVDDHECAEINVLVPRSDIRELELVCKFLEKGQAKVNQSCGLHVHLDFRNKETHLETAASRLTNSLKELALLVPSTRRDNSYCVLGRNEVEAGSRYSAVNLHAFKKFKTLEVRLHSGTTNFRKISSWMLILSNIIDNPAFDKKDRVADIDNFIKDLGFKDDALNYYIYERYKKFNSESAASEEKGIE